ncbi:MAG TPA: hypothetical protein VJ765_10425 [Chitinophagaceae bacterium]|nr:hypothetical protein [Chitinophagaceae bacterium]
MTLPEFLKEFYPVIFSWAAAIVALITFRKWMPLHFKLLLVFVFLYAFADTAGSIIGSYHGLNNHFLYNLIWGVQYMIIAYFYYHTLQNRLIRKVILGFFALFSIFFLINACWIQGFYRLQTYSIVLGASFMLLFAVAYIWQVYTSTETQSIFRDPVFWFSLAWLFYYGLTAPYLGMLNYLLANFPDFAYDYYIRVIDFSDCLRNSLLIIGFLCRRTAMK